MRCPVVLLLSSSLCLSPAQADEDSPDAGDDDDWHGDLQLGISLADGNSEFRSYSLTASSKRRDGPNRWSGKVFVNFAEERDDDNGEFETSEDRRGIEAGLDRFLSERVYLLLQGAFESDEQAEIDLRSTLGAGLGYQLIASERLDYAVEGGLAYIHESFEQPPDDDYPAALLAHELSYRLNPHTRLTHTAELYPSLESSSDAYGNAETGLSFSLGDRSKASLNWSVNWDDSPSANQKSTDHRLGFSLGWEY